jgi:hypothetical protein
MMMGEVFRNVCTDVNDALDGRRGGRRFRFPVW